MSKNNTFPSFSLVLTLLLDHGFEVKRDNELSDQRLSTLFKQWFVGVDILLTCSGCTNGYILDIGRGDYRASGDYILRIKATSEDQLDFKIIINKAVYEWKSPVIVINEWTWVEVSHIRQPDGSYRIFFKIGDSTKTEYQTESENVSEMIQIYFSNYHSQTRADARFNNFMISTIPDKRA